MNVERIQKELVEHEARRKIRLAEAEKRKASEAATDNPWSGKNKLKNK
jgi:hypothetical protein